MTSLFELECGLTSTSCCIFSVHETLFGFAGYLEFECLLQQLFDGHFKNLPTCPACLADFGHTEFFLGKFSENPKSQALSPEPVNVNKLLFIKCQGSYNILPGVGSSVCDGRLPIFSVPPFAYNSGTLLCLHGKNLVFPLAMEKLHRRRKKKKTGPLFDHPKKFWSPRDKNRQPFLPVKMIAP